MKNEPPTKVLKQLGLDGSTIGGFAKPNFSPGWTSNFEQQHLTSTNNFNQHRYRADGILISQLRQYSVVARKHMETLHNYISSIDYINGLVFDYVESYSFQRGNDYEDNLKLTRQEYDRLSVRKEKRNNLTEAEEIRFFELYAFFGFTQYIINDKRQFHPSSKKLNTFKYSDPIVDRLKTILRTEIKDIPMWMCAPTYRDAFVFRHISGNIVSVLNVCLSCQYMETTMLNHINSDFKTYDLLKKYFIDIGHDVEEPTEFVIDNNKNETSQGKSKDL